MAKKIIPLVHKKGPPLKRINYTTSRTQNLMKEFDVLKDQFGKNTFENLYAGITNPYANMENVWEEGVIATKGYEQAQDDLMTGLGTALQTQREVGEVDTGAINKALVDQTRQITRSIEEQETANINRQTQESARLRMAEAEGDFKTDLLRIQGQEKAETLRLQQQQALLTIVSGQIGAGKTEDWRTTGWLKKIFNLF